MRQKILVIDDEADNRTAFGGLLEREGFTVLAEDCARDGFRAAVDSKPDLILCDVSMPGGDSGVVLCRKLKGDKRTARIPIILMSGVHKGEVEQTDGIDQGADDYLPKPFSPGLLFAKVRAVLRRGAAPLEPVLKLEGLRVDVPARTAVLAGERLPLTRKEFDLLTTFLGRPGRVLSVPYLLETVWGYDPADYNDPHTVGVHISSLRKKLGPKLAPKIVSVPGLGYRFDR